MANKIELPALEIPLCIGEKLCKIQQEFKAKKVDLILSGSTILEVQRTS